MRALNKLVVTRELKSYKFILTSDEIDLKICQQRSKRVLN
jgi:hypothetical protein